MPSRLQSAAVMLTAALSLSACGGGDSDNSQTIACTTEVRASLVLTVVDANGAAVPSAAVNYQINGGPTLSLTCPATGACRVGEEQAGRFSLSVSKPGFATSTSEVQVNRDLCHVLTEQVSVVLRASN
jgi:hypothetical protein